MTPVAIPVIVIILGAGAYFRRRKPVEMTPERAKVYKAALSGSLKDPAKLRALSDAFAGEGLVTQAKLLRQRAALRELPETVKRARRQAFRNATKSKNKTAVLELAEAYEKEGCTAAASRLREYASGLRQGQS